MQCVVIIERTQRINKIEIVSMEELLDQFITYLLLSLSLSLFLDLLDGIPILWHLINVLDP